MSEFCYEIADSPDEIIEICKEKSEEEWDDVDVAELSENDKGMKFISLYCSKLRK